MKDADLLLNHDVADSIQGHVGQNTKQAFKTHTAVPFSLPRLKLSGYEFLLSDQFGNHYHKMRAVLFDGELYDVDQFIKPSMMIRHGGGFADFEDKQAKAHLRITEDLLRDLRDNAALIFARTNVDILKARSLSQAPVALETQDITHQANRLEDAIRAAKLDAGEAVNDGEQTPDGFQPIKPENAPETAFAATQKAESSPAVPSVPLVNEFGFPAIVGLKGAKSISIPKGNVIDLRAQRVHKAKP